MNGGGVARRYIKPLFEVAREKGAVKKVRRDLALLDETLRGNREHG